MKKNYLSFAKRRLGTPQCFQFILATLIILAGGAPQNVEAKAPISSRSATITTLLVEQLLTTQAQRFQV